MKISLHHHYGWTRHNIKAKSKSQAAYLAVRGCHKFLTDDNHTWEAGPKKLEWGGKIVKFNSVTIFRNENSPPYNGPPCFDIGYWFAVSYK